MRGLRSLSLIICTTLMFLASSCAPVTQAAPYPNPSVPTDISTFTVTPAKSGLELDIQTIQRIEGKDSHVKVGGSSGFSDPSLPGLVLSTYQTETRYYAFDDQTSQIIAINPVEMPSDSEPISTEELEKIARDLVARASPEINLDVLTPDHGEKRAGKTANLFFRWIDTSKILSNGNHPYIQIGLNGKGELLNYINLIPLAK